MNSNTIKIERFRSIRLLIEPEPDVEATAEALDLVREAWTDVRLGQGYGNVRIMRPERIDIEVMDNGPGTPIRESSTTISGRRVRRDNTLGSHIEERYLIRNDLPAWAKPLVSTAYQLGVTALTERDPA